MRKRVILHGYFKKFYPEPFEVEADTPYEALKSFVSQTKAFPHRAPDENGDMRHQAVIIGCDTVEELYSKTTREEIHVAPSFICGVNSKPLIQIGIGALLIAASFYMPATWAIALPAGQITAGMTAFTIGASLVLGGILQLISPAPELSENATKTSKLLGTPKNTVAIGTPIPILYGEHKVYGHILAYDVDSTNVGKNST